MNLKKTWLLAGLAFAAISLSVASGIVGSRGEVARAAGETKTVYVTNNLNWSTMKIHYWGGTNETSWPGETMTFSHQNDNYPPQDVYKYDIPSDTTALLFHNGSGDQTVDITLANYPDSNAFWIKEEKTGGNRQVGEWNYVEPSVDPEEDPEFKVVGLDGWEYADGVLMEETEKGELDTFDHQYKATLPSLKIGDEFKILAKDGETWYSGALLEDGVTGFHMKGGEGLGADNIVAEEDGVADIYLKKTGETYAIYACYTTVTTKHYLYVGETEYELTARGGESHEYYANEVNLTSGQVITYKKGADKNAVTVTTREVGNNNLDADRAVLVNATNTSINVDVSNNTVWAGGLPESGYHIIKNGNTLIEMTHNENPQDPSYDEYYSELISFAKDDVIRFINLGTNVLGDRIFDITNKSGEEGFEVVDGHLKASKSVSLSVYLKLKYQADEVYFGKVEEEVRLAAEFAKAFNTAIGGVCKEDNKTNVSELATAWGAQKTNFAALGKDVQDVLKEATSGHSVSDIAAFEAKYEYVARKYTTQLGEGYNFLEKTFKTSTPLTTVNDNSNTLILVVAIVSVTLLGGALFFYIRKRKATINK